LKLLLDEMLPPVVAEQLRRRGHDGEAVKERDELMGAPDERLLSIAQLESRVIVTKNIDDFRVLGTVELRSGRSHRGLILVNDGVFLRGGSGSVGLLVNALDALMTSDVDLSDLEHWLRPVDS
jgi:hypothetical protein